MTSSAGTKNETSDFALADYIAIQKLIHRYAYLIDSGQFDEMGALFDRADVYIGGELAVRNDGTAVSRLWESYVRMYPNGTPRTHHIATNVSIEPDGVGIARAHSYILVVQNPTDVPLVPITAGDYLDRFVKDEGVWYFSERRVGNDLFGDMSHHLTHPMQVNPNAAPQRWDLV
ncbi:nuclear transport factor 2 family protein [Rhodococcus sp. C26F]